MNCFFRCIADDINRLTSSEFQRRLMADRSTKLELILAGKYSMKIIIDFQQNNSFLLFR